LIRGYIIRSFETHILVQLFFVSGTPNRTSHVDALMPRSGVAEFDKGIGTLPACGETSGER
jgi:hypothetical protein